MLYVQYSSWRMMAIKKLRIFIDIIYGSTGMFTGTEYGRVKAFTSSNGKLSKNLTSPISVSIPYKITILVGLFTFISGFLFLADILWNDTRQYRLTVYIFFHYDGKQKCDLSFNLDISIIDHIIQFSEFFFKLYKSWFSSLFTEGCFTKFSLLE